MIRGQCRADCQCAFCAGQEDRPSNADTNVLRVTGNGTSTKDELYAKSLRDTIRTRALMGSSRNAHKFIPDEQLLSSAKRREDKERATASQMVPLRRRDRIEELLVLEHKARLQEEGRRRAARRAAGLPDDEFEEEAPSSGGSAQGSRSGGGSTHGSRRSGGSTPASEDSAAQGRLVGSRRPDSACDAGGALWDTLHRIKDIVDSDLPERPQQPFGSTQIDQFRRIVYEQEKKNRAQVEACENQPHICNHCFGVNVQARHLCPPMTGSVAFAQTGKVIHPQEGVMYGTKSERRPDGTYDPDTVDQRLVSGRPRIIHGSISSHPYGTGVVLRTFQSPPAAGTLTKSLRFVPTFNNNIGADEAVEADMQFPGSTYNVYDARADGLEPVVPRGNSADSGGVNGAKAHGPVSNQRAADSGRSGPADYSGNKTTSSMWLTTNQARQADMDRFIEFQDKMNDSAKKVYGSTTTRGV